MSKTIDEKVVEMRLDNSDFEKNASKSIGTLAKLKQSLKFTGASKGLEQVNEASKKVDMKGLGSAVETITARFSALQVMGVTALANITNSAINTGKKMLSALTIDPVMSGFSEYETKMGSIQTILANTQHEGTTLDDVTSALDDLNTYADKTIYNFQEMTRNIGTFTAAGVDLNTSVESIKGIANLAAVSGSTSQQASTAMYQLSQALAAGKVSLMDWNSVVNAGMGGKVFQDALIRTSELLKTGAKDAIATYGNFRESLTQGEWLTTEVLTETLKQFSGAYTEADLIAQGFTESQAKEIAQLAQTATDAATKVKTFTQLFDTLKESAQSGWAQTWELMIGDFEEAKEFFTGLSDSVGGFINNMSEYRNKLIGGVFNSNWDKLVSKINDAGIKTGEYEEKIRSVAEAHGITSDKFDEIIEKHGSLSKAIKEGAISSDILKEALNELGLTSSSSDDKLSGFVDKLNDIEQTLRYGSIGDDVKTLQTALEELGYSVGECGIDGIIGSDTTKAIKEFQEAAGIAVDGVAGPDTLAALKKAGTNVKEISENVKDTSVSYDELIDNITEKGGRELFLEGFGNTIKGLVGILKTIGAAWSDIFPAEGIQKGLMSTIEAFNTFSKSLLLTEETLDENGEVIVKFNDKGDKLVRTFKGLFAIVRIVTDIIGGGLRIAFKVANAILGYFNLNILDVTAIIGDALVKFRELTDISNLLSKAIEFMSPYLNEAGKAIKGWCEAFMDLPGVRKTIYAIKDAFVSFKKIKFKEFGKNIIEGLKDGLGDGVKKVINKIADIAKSIISKFCDILGIHSPSKVMMAIGGFIVAGLVLGITNAFPELSNGLQTIATKCIEFFKGIDWGSIFAIGISLSMIYFVKKIYDIFQTLSGPIEAITNILEACANVVNNVSDVVKNFAKLEKALAFNIRMEGIKTLATAVAILAGSVILLSFVDTKKLWNAVLVVGVLSGILVALAWAADKMSSASASIDKDGINIDGFKSGLLAIAGSLIIIAAAVKLMGSMRPSEMEKGFLGLAGIVVAIGAVFAAYGLVAKYLDTTNIDKVGGMLFKISISLALIAAVVKVMSGVKWTDMGKAAAGIAGLVVVIAALTAISLIPGKNVDKIGDMLLKISAAMLILVGVAKIIAGMEWTDMGKAAVGIAGLVGIIALLVTITTIPGQNIDRIGSTLAKIAAAMLILTVTVKLLAGIEWADMGKGIVGLLGLSAVVAALIGIVRLVGSDAPKIAATLLAISVAVGILAAVAIVLSLVSVEGLLKGVTAVGVLSTFMALMIYATRGASECKGNLIAMSIAIGVLAGSVALLSLIDTTKLAGATLALSALMGMFALIIKMSGNVQNSVGTLVVMTVAVGLLAGVLYLLSGLPVESTLVTAASLSMLLLSLSVSMGVLGGMTTVTPMALAAVGVLTLVVGALAGILYLLKDMPVESTLTTAASLSMLLLSLSGACAILSLVGLTGAAAFVGIAALGTLIVGVGGVIVAIGALVTEFPKLEEFLNTGIPILEKIGYGLGSFAGNIVRGFSEGVAAMLPVIGTQLSMFMTNATPFIVGAKLIDASVVTGVGCLAGAIIALTAANLIAGITQFLPFVGSFSDLGIELSMFMMNAMPFIVGIKTVDPAYLEGVKSLAQAILIITAANIIKGITSWMSGGNSICEFGSELGQLGTDMNSFATNLGTFDKNKVNTVTCAANAIKSMAQAAKNIPNEGGLWGKIFGENGIGAFSMQLPIVGASLSSFATNLGTFDKNKVNTVTCAANAIKTMAETAKNIPNEGGLWSKIFGENSLATFASKLPKVGTNLSSFASNLGTFNNSTVTTVTCASNAIKSMAQVAKNIPSDGGLWSKIFGENSLATFASKLPKVGTNLSSFASNLGTFGESKIATVRAAVKSIDALSGLANSDLKGAKKNLDGFGDKLAPFAKDLAAFCSKMPSSATMDGAVKVIKKIINAIDELSGRDPSVLTNFSKKLKDIGTDAVSKFVKAFTSESSKTNVKNAGIKLMNNLVTGVNSKKNDVKDASKKVAESGASGAGSWSIVNEFKSAGKDLGDGLVKGIEAKETAVYNAGYKLGQKAVKGEKDGQKSKSPSKLTILAGKWLGEGLVIGMERMTKSVYNAGYGLGDSATQTISSTIARIGNMVESDIDAQPTIRPVLDLSDISTGVDAMHGMLDFNSSVGLMSNLRSISALNESRQNGNEDVVAAINKLNKSLNNLPSGNNYNINGITYSNGNEISDAVNVLVRATMMEGRV